MGRTTKATIVFLALMVGIVVYRSMLSQDEIAT